MRTRNGANESRIGRKSSVAGPATGDDWVHTIDGGSTGELSRGRTQAQDTDDYTTFGGQDGAGTTPVAKAPWFEPIEDNGCVDGVCPVPWLANTFLTEDRNSNFPGENTIPQRPDLQPDLVNHPPHYNDGSIECIDAIEAQLTPEEFRGYLKGSIAKYNWRERHKGGTESLKKARFYLNRIIEFDEN
jgi:hypothetical protein